MKLYPVRVHSKEHGGYLPRAVAKKWAELWQIIPCQHCHRYVSIEPAYMTLIEILTDPDPCIRSQAKGAK